MGIFQQLVYLSFKDSIPEGRKFCSGLPNDVSICLSPDNTLVIVAPGDHLTPRINDQAVTDKLCPSVDPCAIGRDEEGEILQRPGSIEEEPMLQTGRGPGRADEKEFGPLIEHLPEQFWKS
jgi:hypothetical protein